MGSIASSLFGGNKTSSGGTSNSSSTSLSENQAYPFLQGALSPQVNNAGASSNAMADLLGLNGGGAQNAGFDNWRNSTGYQFGMDQGTQAITGGAASKGLLNSGATAKALQKFGTGYANQQFGNYFNQMLGLGNMGNQAAGVLTNAGQKSTSQSNSQSQQWSKGQNSSGGLGSFIGSILTK
jgi:hypothetical protein